MLKAFEVFREHEVKPTTESTGPSLAKRLGAGEDLCARIYGKAYDALRENVRGLHPDLDQWMIEDGYGKTLSRSGLSACDRELCIVAQLAASGHDRQLKAHLFGALNVGASPEAVESALKIGIDSGTPDGRTELMSLWNEVRHRVGL